MESQYRNDPIKERTVMDIQHWGESYSVNCPFCSDTRQRLSINHRYGVYDEITGSENIFMARCYNDDCLKQSGRYVELRDRIFGFINFEERRQLTSRFRYPTGKVIIRPPVAEASPPGEIIALHDLPEDHVAIQYLRGRGFDPNELSRDWHLSYCVKADKYSFAQDRIIIPVVFKGVWVGWQARFLGDKDWKAENQPKYFTSPGMRKNHVLYNYDQAIKQPFVVVCEGPSDAWKIGPAAVALFGKTASPTQVQLLLDGWHDKPIVVMLDGDARIDSAALCQRLKKSSAIKVIAPLMASGSDPGSMNCDEIWQLINAAATKAGIQLPKPTTMSSINEMGPIEAISNSTLEDNQSVNHTNS